MKSTWKGRVQFLHPMRKLQRLLDWSLCLCYNMASDAQALCIAAESAVLVLIIKINKSLSPTQEGVNRLCASCEWRDDMEIHIFVFPAINLAQLKLGHGWIITSHVIPSVKLLIHTLYIRLHSTALQHPRTSAPTIWAGRTYCHRKPGH